MREYKSTTEEELQILLDKIHGKYEIKFHAGVSTYLERREFELNVFPLSMMLLTELTYLVDNFDCSDYFSADLFARREEINRANMDYFKNFANRSLTKARNLG